jgi:hypothetical protein
MAGMTIAARTLGPDLKWFRMLVAVFVLLMLGDFILGGILPSLKTARNDFSDPFVGSWLWTHGQNPYNSALVEATAERLTQSMLPVVPIYPLTAYVLVAPFSLLPWGWANFVWAVLSAAAVGLISWTLLRIAGFEASDTRAWLLVALVFGFTPLHRAIHTENAAIIVVAICILAVYLAGESQNLSAGILLAIATGVKPQLGFWILVFYLVQLRWTVVITGVSGFATLLVVACARFPQSLRAVFLDYREDLHYWFGPGGPNDFTAGNSLRFQLVNLQVILWQWLQGRATANILAGAFFLLGLGVWTWTIVRGRMRSPLLTLTALLALSFLSIYHSVTDASILLLGYAWVLGTADAQLKRTKWVVVLLLLGLSLPTHSFLLRLEPHLSRAATSSWWWTGIIAPCFIWNMLLLNVVLIAAMVLSGRGAPSGPPWEATQREFGKTLA